MNKMADKIDREKFLDAVAAILKTKKPTIQTLHFAILEKHNIKMMH